MKELVSPVLLHVLYEGRLILSDCDEAEPSTQYLVCREQGMTCDEGINILSALVSIRTRNRVVFLTL